MRAQGISLVAQEQNANRKGNLVFSPHEHTRAIFAVALSGRRPATARTHALRRRTLGCPLSASCVSHLAFWCGRSSGHLTPRAKLTADEKRENCPKLRDTKFGKQTAIFISSLSLLYMRRHQRAWIALMKELAGWDAIIKERIVRDREADELDAHVAAPQRWKSDANWIQLWCPFLELTAFCSVCEFSWKSSIIERGIGGYHFCFPAF